MPKDVHHYIRMSMPCHCLDWIRPNTASMPDRSTNEDTSHVTATYSFYPDESCPYARPTMTQTIATASPLQGLPLHSVHYRRLSSAYSRSSRHAVLVHIGSSSVELEDRRLDKLLKIDDDNKVSNTRFSSFRSAIHLLGSYATFQSGPIVTVHTAAASHVC